MPNITTTYREKYEEPNSDLTRLRHFARALKKNLKVMLPVKVISVDHTKQHVDLEVLAKDIDDKGDTQSYPILPNVPIRYPLESSKAFIRIPVQVDDTGTVEFFDSSIANYKVQGVVEYHYDENSHTLTDGLYTSGFYAEKDVYVPINPSDPIIIGLKNSKMEIRVDDDGVITITTDDDLNVTCKKDITVHCDGNTSVTSDGNLNVTGTNITATCSNITTLKSNTHIFLDTPLVYIGGGLTSVTGLTTITGNININGTVTQNGEYWLNGKNIEDHTHPGVTAGPSNTGPF